MTPTTLILCLGNPDRTDDGVGWVVAEEVRRAVAGQEAVEVRVCYQLTPELAETLSQVERVLFVDATVAEAEGRVVLRRLVPAKHSVGDFSHRLPPAQLLGLTEAVYAHVPDAALLTVPAHELGFGQELSEKTARLVSEAVARARAWAA